MYTCDKCGCEHTSRTTCPKCGAPVIIVNQDYLLRRQEWEAKQRANLRWKSREDAAEDIDNNVDESDVADARPEIEEIDGFEFINIASDDSDRKKSNIVSEYINEIVKKITKKLRQNSKKRKEQQQRIKRHKNEDHSLEVETDEEKASMEKLMLDHIIFKRNTGKYIGMAAAVMVLISGLVYGVNRFINMDRSDLIYFDGHELISVEEGSLLNVDRSGENYSFVAYSNELNAIVMKSDDSYVGWYEGKEWPLNMDYGKPMQQFIFSDSGRFMSYTTYDEAEDKYFIILCDMKEQQFICYHLDQRAEIIGVNDAGKVGFVTLDTTGYSLVLDMKLYTATMKNKYIISNSVSQAEDRADEIVFIEDGNLYSCPVSDKVLNKYDGLIAPNERTHIAEEVLAIVDNQLGNELLYITEAGLWEYEKGVSRLLAKGAEASSQVYYSADGGFLYYRNMNNLYSVDAAGISSLIIEGMSSDVDSDKNQKYILVVDSENNLWKLNSGKLLLDSGVTQCGVVTGANACTYIKNGQLIYNDFDKQVIISTNNVQNADRVFCSRKYLYFVDSSNVLWKIDKKGKNQESMGYVQLIVHAE